MDVSHIVSAQKLHHAYLIAGSAERGLNEVVSALKRRGIQTAGNPDCFSITVTEFTVDMARQVASFASLKPVGENKYVLVSWSRATNEAQNALLKSVEEGIGNTIFFFSVDSAGHMLPTLRSRCVPLSVPRHETDLDEEAESFARAPYAERMTSVERMANAITKTQDRASVRNFIRSLVSVFRHDASASALRDLLDADRYVRMQGASAKSVLGHLAVTLPRKKQ